MVQVNAIGDTCPIPVIKAKKAIEALTGADTVEVLVDNDFSVQNLLRMAHEIGAKASAEKTAEGNFRVRMEIGDAASKLENIPEDCLVPAAGRKKRTVVAVTSKCMGSGDDTLGASLMKAFLFSLTQQETLPDTILFYNGGAYLTTEGSASLDDIKTLEAAGVEILTCGTCLNFYGLGEKLRVGGVTNMYAIAEKLLTADLVIRP